MHSSAPRFTVHSCRFRWHFCLTWFRGISQAWGYTKPPLRALFCSWQEYFERRSYRKTGLLLHLMHKTMPVCTAQAAESTRPALGNSHACRALALFGL